MHDMLMQRKSAVESNAQVPNWRAEFNTSAINIHEFCKMLQVNNLFSVQKSAQIFILMLEEIAVVQTRNPHDCSDHLNMQ